MDTHPHVDNASRGSPTMCIYIYIHVSHRGGLTISTYIYIYNPIVGGFFSRISPQMCPGSGPGHRGGALRARAERSAGVGRLGGARGPRGLRSGGGRASPRRRGGHRGARAPDLATARPTKPLPGVWQGSPVPFGCFCVGGGFPY